MSGRKLRSYNKFWFLTFCLEKLESWFCGSLTLGEFILATGIEMPTSQRPLGQRVKTQLLMVTLAFPQSGHGRGLSAPSLLHRELPSEGQRPGMKISPLPFEILVLCSSLKPGSVTDSPVLPHFHSGTWRGWLASQADKRSHLGFSFR